MTFVTRSRIVTTLAAGLLSATSIANASPPHPAESRAPAMREARDTSSVESAGASSEAYGVDAGRHTASPALVASRSFVLERGTSARVIRWDARTISRAGATAPRVFFTVDAPRLRGRLGIGRTWRFAHGVRLAVDLTPSPKHSAPFVVVRY